jgi:hypoxia up-regulated 1
LLVAKVYVAHICLCDSEAAYSPEELVAMILNYTRIIAQDYAEQPIRDCVITVPVFYTQAQRRAMLYAANLVGLNVLQLMTDAAASELSFPMPIQHQSCRNIP